MHRASSPYRAPSPFAQPIDPQYAAQQYAPAGVAQVGPGSVTYTTSTGPDGRVIYHPFKAVAASYQTPSGVVSGIQWVPAEATTILPQGAQPMNAPGPNDHPSRGHNQKDHKSTTSDWQRADEKRRKQEEKEARRLREQGPPRNDPDYDLQKARERDAHSSMNRERRKSFNAGAAGPPPVTFPTSTGSSGYPTHPSVATGYPSGPYSGYGGPAPGPPAYGNPNTGHTRQPSGAYSDLSRQFNDFDIDRNRDSEHERKSSTGRPRKYSTNEPPHGMERPRTVSSNHGDRPGPHSTPQGGYPPASAPYSNPKNQPYPTHHASPSPNIRPVDLPYGSSGPSGYPGPGYSSPPTRNPADTIGRSTTPFGGPPTVYPKGHILEGQPLPQNHPISRAPSPNPMSFPNASTSPYPGKSPHLPPTAVLGEPQQLPAPDAFSRPINAANSFAPFETTKINDMEDIYEPNLPKMPPVLTTHDIRPEDWRRCMQDLGRSWTGHLPVAGLGNDGRPPRPSTLAADLIELWNTSFFYARGVELVLCKGKERRTGKPDQIGAKLPHYNDEDSSATESSSESDLSDYDTRATGPYGRPNAMAEVAEARRRRREEKREKRRRRKEKRARRKAKAYTVFVACLPPRGPTPFGAGRGFAPAAGGYSPMQGVPGGYGIPVSHSHGYGGGY